MARDWWEPIGRLALSRGNSALGLARSASLASVANGASLTAVPTSILVPGALAYVATFGAYFSLQPSAGLLVDGSTVLPSDAAGLVWSRVLTAVALQALARSSWEIDPAAGDNENTGLPGSPLKEYAEIARRWGTTAPRLSIIVTITWLSDAAASDSVVLEPYFVGPGGLRIQGTLQPLGAATLDGFTPQNKATGTPSRIHVTGQAWTPGTIVRDTTRGATFAIDEDLGAGTAQITSPAAFPVVFVPIPVALVVGDSLSLFRPTTIYIERLIGVSLGDGSGQQIIVRNVGLTGELVALVGGSSTRVLECTVFGCVLETVHNNDSVGPGLPLFVSTWFGFGPFGGGAFSGQATFWAGALNGAGNSFVTACFLDFDVLVNLRAHVAGLLIIGSAYFGQWPENTVSTQTFAKYLVMPSDSGIATVWGPATIAPSTTSELVVRNATAVGSLLCTGGLTIAGASIAFPWDAASHSFLAAVPITPANIDLYGALQEPSSGTRIAIAA